MQPNDVTRSKQLLVEGKDAEVFFYTFVVSLNITDIQIQNYGGIAELPNFLGQLTKNSNFRKLVTSLGITRDAEENSGGAFQSVCSALTSVNLLAPTHPVQSIGTSPRVNIFIFPGNDLPGMLESLLLQAVSDDPAINCIDEFIYCVEQANHYTPKPVDKAKILAFLASREQIKPLIGHAARAGYWNFGDPTYNQLKDFVRSL